MRARRRCPNFVPCPVHPTHPSPLSYLDCPPIQLWPGTTSVCLAEVSDCLCVCVCGRHSLTQFSLHIFPTIFSDLALRTRTHTHTHTPSPCFHSAHSFAVVARPRRRRRRLLRCRHLSRSRVCAKVFPRVDVDFPFFCCCFCISLPREKFVVTGSAADFSELYMLT